MGVWHELTIWCELKNDTPLPVLALLHDLSRQEDGAYRNVPQLAACDAELVDEAASNIHASLTQNGTALLYRGNGAWNWLSCSEVKVSSAEIDIRGTLAWLAQFIMQIGLFAVERYEGSSACKMYWKRFDGTVHVHSIAPPWRED